ncbi:ferredoxin [Candidatus Gracilibacteria bacterium]|nr:ferredoxin [Candidatus Gracilibacteria bacterium]
MTAIISEEQVKKLREAHVAVPDVNETCIGCSACVAIAPDVFELNDDGLSEVVSRENYEGLEVDDAIAACPVDAISWVE